MSDLDKQLRNALSNAFDEVHAPENLKIRTLEAIEARRAEVKDICTDAYEAVSEGQSGNEFQKLQIESEQQVAKKQLHKKPELHKKKRFRAVSSLRAKIAVAACTLLMVVGVCGGAYAYGTPTAYVGIEVNPSIELGVNCFDYVVSAEGVNADGAAILDTVKVTNMPYEEAIKALDEELSANGYLTSDSMVAITIACNDNERCLNLESASQRCFETSGQEIHCSRATTEDHQEAHKLGLGMGKYQAWCELVDAGIDITSDEASNMTMAELRSLANQNGIDLSIQGSAGQEETASGAGHNGQGGANSTGSNANNSKGAGQTSGVSHDESGTHGHKGNGHSAA